MWERFSNLASVVTGQEGENTDDHDASAASRSGHLENVNEPNDLQIQMVEQERLILQLKEMIRERDKTLFDKENELKKISADFSKHRLQSKSKIARLTSQLDMSQKVMSESLESASVCSDESTNTLASETSSVVAEQKSRARLLVLKKQLKEKDQKLAEKDAVIKHKEQEIEAKERIIAERESITGDIQSQLMEQTNLVEYLRLLIRESTDGANSAEQVTRKQLENAELADEVISLRNHVAELEEEKGNLQLQLLEMEEATVKQVSNDDEVMRLKNELNDLQEFQRNLQQANELQESVITELKGSLKEEQNKADHRISTEMNEIIESAVHDLKVELVLAKKSIEEKNQEFSDLELRMKEILEQNGKERTEASQLLQDKFNAQLEDISKRNLMLSATIAELENEKSEKSLNMEKLESDNLVIINALRNEEMKVLNEIKNLEDKDFEIQHLCNDLQALREQLMTYKENELDMRNQVKMLAEKDNRIEQLNETVTVALEQLSTCQLKEQEFDNNLTEKTSKIKILEDEVKSVTEKLIEFEKKEQKSISSLAEITLEKDHEINKLRETGASLSRQLMEYEEKMKEFHNLVADNDSMKANLLEKDEKLLKLMNDVDSGLTEIQTFRSKVEGSTLIEQQLRMKMEVLEEELIDKDSRISSSESRNNQLEMELENMTMKLKNINQKSEDPKVSVMEPDLHTFKKQADERIQNFEDKLLGKDEGVQRLTKNVERFQEEVENLTSRLRESEDLVRLLEKKVIDGERRVESLTQNLEEEEMQLVTVTEEQERVKIEMSNMKVNQGKLENQLMQKDDEIKLLMERSDEKDLQVKKYLTLIKKLKQKQQNEEILQKQSESFNSDLQLCKDELEEKQTEITKILENVDELHKRVQEKTEELMKLRDVSEELKEMTIKWNDLTEELRTLKLDKERVEKDLTTIQMKLEQKELLLSTIQTEIEAHGDDDVLSRIALVVEEVQHLQREISNQKQLLEVAEAEVMELSGQTAEYNQKILRFEQEITLKCKDIETLRSENNELTMKLNQFQMDKNDMLDEIKSYQSSLSSKDSLIASLNAELEIIRSDFSETKSCKDFSSAEIESLRRELLSLSDTLSKTEDEKLILRSMMEQLKAENFDLVDKLEASNEELLSLQSSVQLSASVDEVTSLRSQVAEAEATVEELNSRLHSVRTEREATLNEMALLKNTMEQMRMEAEREKSHAADLDVELDTLSNRVQMLIHEKVDQAKDLSGAETALSSLKAEHGQLMAEKAHLEVSIQQMNTSCQRLIEENRKLKSSNDSLAATLEEVEVEKSEVASQLSRLTSKNLETENLIRERESLDVTIKDMQLEIDTLRGSSRTQSHDNQQDLPHLEEMKEKCSNLDSRCQALVQSLSAQDAEIEALLKKLNESNSQCDLAEGKVKEHEFKLNNSFKALEDLQRSMQEEKMRLENEACKLKERAFNAESRLQQLLTDMEIERQHFETVETELQGSVEELELQVARLTQKLEMLEEQNEKQLTDSQLCNNDLLAQLENCLEERRHVDTKAESDRLSWKQKEESFLLELETSRTDRIRLEEEVQRKLKASQEQYNMLADDINHYQDLVDQLKMRNSSLEQSVRDLGATMAVQNQEKSNQSLEMDQTEKERLAMREQLEELSELRIENSSLIEEIEKLKEQIQAFTEAEDEAEDIQSRYLTIQGENSSLKQKIEEQLKQLEDYKALETEYLALNRRYEKVLQDNNVLIHQSEAIYTQIRHYKENETEFVVLKERLELMQHERDALADERGKLRDELLGYLAQNNAAKELLPKEKQETSQLIGEHLPVQPESLRQDLARTVSRSVTQVSAIRQDLHAVRNQERHQTTTATDELDEDTPRIHAATTTSFHPDIRRTLSERDIECSLLTNQVTELTMQRDQLISHLQQKDHELANVHQQYQIFCHQYALLQQHYNAVIAEQKNATDSVDSKTHSASDAHVQHNIQARPSSTRNQDIQNVAAFGVSKRIEDSETLRNELVQENTRLEQHLESEREKCLRLQEILASLQEQLKLQELSSQDSHSITILEQEEERKLNRMKTGTAYHSSSSRCTDFQRCFDGSSILLGRILRGQPQVRKAIFLYIVALHVYVIFGCLLSML